MQEIGFGVIGLGMGMGRCKMIHDTEGAKLVAVSDLKPERRDKAVETYGVEAHEDYHQLLDRKDVDVIMVMAPSGVHAEMGVEVARAGKHVITTKPIDVTLEAADKLIAECNNANVKLCVDFDSRYGADNVKVQQAIDEGKFGELILGEARLKWFRAQQYYEGWHGTWKLDGGGSLMNQTVHWVDLLQWFMGPVETVTGQIGIFTHDIETEDLGMAMLKFKNGAFGTLLGTTTYPADAATKVEIHGDKGAVVTSNNKIEHWKIVGQDEATDDFVYEGPKNVIEDMIGVITEGKEPRVSGPEGRKSLELVLAVYESAKKGATVILPL